MKDRRVKNQITNKCRQDRDKWVKEVVEETDEDIKDRQGKVYFKIEKLKYKPRSKSTVVKDKQGNMLTDNVEIWDRWNEYIESYSYNGRGIGEEDEFFEHLEKERNDNLGPAVNEEVLGNLLH